MRPIRRGAGPAGKWELGRVGGGELMGAASSRLEKALGEQFPEGERYFGLENFGNTCYCNSVLQVRTRISSFGVFILVPRGGRAAIFRRIAERPM